jgi:hypothetical protein
MVVGIKVIREMMVSILEDGLIGWLGDGSGREERFVKNIRV